MTHDTSTATLRIEGFTPYAQIPRWILRAGDTLSHGAVRLYGVIMSYADNDTKAAFPSKEKLSEDLGASVRSVFTYMKELEDHGVIRVERRRNKRTGNFYANHYVLMFSDPSATDCRRPSEADCPTTRPTVVPRTTKSFTSEESDTQNTFTAEQSSAEPNIPHGITRGQRQTLRRALQAVGEARSNGDSFWDEGPQSAWQDFCYALEDVVGAGRYADQFADILDNGKWTIAPGVASPYVAGAQLNKILNTGNLA